MAFVFTVFDLGKFLLSLIFLRKGSFRQARLILTGLCDSKNKMGIHIYL